MMDPLLQGLTLFVVAAVIVCSSYWVGYSDGWYEAWAAHLGENFDELTLDNRKDR